MCQKTVSIETRRQETFNEYIIDVKSGFVKNLTTALRVRSLLHNVID